MAKFSFVPREEKFFDLFVDSARNMVKAARGLKDMLDNWENIGVKAAEITELEHEGDTITLQPLKNLVVERDLMVKQDKFFDKYRAVKPFLINDEPVQEKERLQLPLERKKIDEATKCILCESCYSACPVIVEKNPMFLGPAAIVQAARFLDDNRDRGFVARLDTLDKKNGVWPCENHYECTRVCPRGIKVTKLINLTKQKIKKFRNERGEKIRDQ